MTGTAYAIEGIGLSRHYGGFAALDSVDIRVAPGEVRGLIGPNGAGKSTLIDTLSGRARRWSGRIRLMGDEIGHLSVQQRRHRGLARSFQRTNIFSGLSVGDQLDVAAHVLGEGDVADVVDALSLGPLVGRSASEISYGDQRRLDLALALVGRPKVLLLDEPAAGLTVEESMALAKTLRELVVRWGVTVLLVEHDMDVVFSICDRITVLHLGRVLAEGAVSEIRVDPAVISAYLGTSAQ